MSVKARSRILMIVAIIGLIIVTFAMNRSKNITIPYEAETKDGKILITSMFKYTGANPFYKNKKGEDIAAITVENPESNYDINTAIIKITMKDRSIYNFQVDDLAAGESVDLYDLHNIKAILADKNGKPIPIRDISVKATFYEE